MSALLTEQYTPSSFFTIVESTGGVMRVRGEFGRADVPTANGRVYTTEVWRKEIARIKRKLAERKVVGELDHPTDGRLSLQRTSHLITDLRLENGIVIGEAEILTRTDMGRQLAALFEHKVKVGVSSRGQGSVVPDGNGHDVVQSDFKLVTFDFVADPADVHAYPTVIAESVKVDGGPVRFAGECLPGEQCFLSAVPARETSEPVKVATLVEMQAASDAIKADLRRELLSEHQQGLQNFAPTDEDRMKFEEQLSLLEERLHKMEAANRALLKKTRALEEENAKLHHAGRLMGLGYVLETHISGHEFESALREHFHDVSGYETQQDLVEAIEEAAGLLREQHQILLEEEARHQEAQRTLLEERERLAEDNRRLVATMHRLQRVAQQNDVRAYAESVVARHPNRGQIKALIERFEPETREDVDAIVEQFRPKVQSPEGIQRAISQVREALGTAVAVRQEMGNRKRESLNEDNNYNGLGMPLSDITKHMPDALTQF